MRDFGKDWTKVSEERKFYILKHLPRHLADSSYHERLYSLLTHIFFLEAKTETISIFALAADFTHAVGTVPNDYTYHKILRLLEEAIRRDIHFIARHAGNYPQALFQCLWNLCWWYDCPEAAKHYKVPEGGWSEAPPWDQPGPKLHKVLETWRRAKESATPGFIWLQSLRPPSIPLGFSQTAVLHRHEGAVKSVACSRDGSRMASCSDDATVRVWDAASGEELLCIRLARYVDFLRRLAFSPDGRLICAVQWNRKSIRMWDAYNGRELNSLIGHADDPQCVAFSPDGRWIVTGSKDQTVRVWDVSSGTEVLRLPDHGSWVLSVAYESYRKQIASGSWDGTIRIWDAETGDQIRCMVGHGGPVWSVAFSPDGRRIVSGSDDGTLRIWEIDTGIHCLHSHHGGVSGVAYSPDGLRIASCGLHDFSIRIWDPESGTQLVSYRGHEGSVFSVTFLDSWRVVSVSADGSVRIWNTQGDVVCRILRGHDTHCWVTALTFSPDGLCLASSSEDGTVQTWSSETGVRLRILSGHKETVTAVAYAWDGQRIVSGSDDGELRVWDAKEGTELCVLQGHKGPVDDVAFSSDCRRIISEAEDGTTRVWDIESKKCLAVLDGQSHVFPVAAQALRSTWRALASAPDTAIETASGGDTVAWFPTTSGDIQASADRIVWAIREGNCFHIIRLEGDHFHPSARLRKPCAFCGVKCAGPYLTHLRVWYFGTQCFTKFIEQPASKWRTSSTLNRKCVLCHDAVSIPYAEAPIGPICSTCIIRCSAVLAYNEDMSKLSTTTFRKMLSSTSQLRLRLTFLWRASEVFEIVGRGKPNEIERVKSAIIQNLGYSSDHPLAPSVRQAAVDACIVAGKPILPLLLRLGKPEPWQFLANIVLAAGTIAPEDESVQSLLKDAARHPEPGIRMRVVMAIGDHDSSWAQALMASMATDPDPSIRELL